MGHTNSTANLSLPQFIGSDKPTWLGDINGAFSDIDAYVGTNDAAVSAAASDASSAVAQAASAVSTANAANTTAGNASTAATNAVGTANNAMSLVNQTNVKVGTLADLTTTDKTSIVNAINEINGKDAGDIAYDNSGSGLTATNVQDAIDEVAQGGGGGSVAWQLAGTQTGTTPISTPATFNELLIVIDDTHAYITMPVIPAMLSGTPTLIRGGYYGTSSAMSSVNVSSSEVALVAEYYENTDVTSSTTISLYYR